MLTAAETAIVWAAAGALILGIILFVVGPAIFGRFLRRNHVRRLKEQGLSQDRDPEGDDPA
jgi:Na+-driven multidrug efflux pump